MKTVNGFNIDEHNICPSACDKEVTECCGACRFMKHEDIDGYGICDKFDTPVYCGDEPCKLYEENYE